VQPQRGVDEATLRLFLTGAVFAVLLHQRGHLVLHANTVSTQGSAVALLGAARSGKSTLAATLQCAGLCFVADDVTAIQLDSGDSMVLPGFPQLKLWPEAAKCVVADPEALPRLRPGYEKRGLPIDDSLPRAPLPLTHIYVLAQGPDPAVEALAAQDALLELLKYSYCRALVPLDPLRHLRQCGTVIRRTVIRRLRAPRSLSLVPELARLIEDDVRRDA